MRVFAATICLPNAIGQRADCLNRKAAGKIILRIGLVELLGKRMRGRRLVHADRLIEAAENDVASLRHQIAADAYRLNSPDHSRNPGMRN